MSYVMLKLIVRTPLPERGGAPSMMSLSFLILILQVKKYEEVIDDEYNNNRGQT